MAHEGMVHALQQIHGLLKPEGRLVDIHPTPEAPLYEIHQQGEIVFSGQTPTYDIEDILQADKALAHVIERGWFVVERAGHFDFRVYGSSVSELRDYLAEASAFSDHSWSEEAAQKEELIAHVEGLMRVAGEGAEVATYERVSITRLKPVR